MLLKFFEFNIQYLISSLIFSFVLCFVSLKCLIAYFRKINGYQVMREAEHDYELAPHHEYKKNTPTMGGVAIVGTIFLNTLLFADVTSLYVVAFLIILLSFGILGFIDDFNKVVYKNVLGLQGSIKLVLQLVCSAIAIFLLVYKNIDYLNTTVFFPILNLNIPLSNFILAFYMLIIAGSGNAVNISDGLDGLISLPVILICIGFLFVMYYVDAGTSVSMILIEPEILINYSVIIVSFISSILAFLIFNCKPAKIFMGDVGSLAIGSTLCFIAIVLKIEFIYAIMALMFILEIFSTVLQVYSIYFRNGKRIFKMAPFHHHLEQSGWSEGKVVVAFWFFALICNILALWIYLICFR